MKKLLFALFLVISLAACTGNTDDITRVLKAEGCTDIHLTGYSIFGCGDKYDGQSCGFTATKNGYHVEGVVCSGLYKGYTIRYF